MIVDSLTASLDLIINQTQANMKTLGIILLILWLAFIVNRLMGNRFLHFGIIPRHLSGLPGILLSPFLHVNFNHLFLTLSP